MKVATLLTIFLASLLVLLTVTSTALLSDLSEPTADLRYEDLEAGWLLPMFCGPTLWSSFPTFPEEIAALADLSALGYVCFCLSVIVATGRRWRLTSRTGAAVLTLGLGILPSVLGAIVLQGGSASPTAVGAVVSFMIIGLLYCALASLVLAIADLPRPNCFAALGIKRTSPLSA